MITCIAVDDEPLALEVLQAFCSRVPFLDLQKTFTSTNEAAKHLRKFPVDLVFLDIQMPEISGIDFYKTLSNQPMVIFTTAFSEYAVEGFNLSAVDYLLKPVEFNRFLLAVNKANDYHTYLTRSQGNENKHLFVRSEYSLVKIAFADILYIETLDDYLKIHLPGKKPVLTLMSMKSIQEKLSPDDFIRVHRSYIVPLNRIESVRGKTINLGVAEIPIGTRYEAEFFKVYVKRHY
ncbi:MAG: LytTR family two component transcriptional regulator [Bacteroidetes bacterium]|nr:MAG: LytTR family two component transcriptional regulator [Bacteroidota bacterium]